MRWRENVAVKALAFTPAGGGGAPPPHPNGCERGPRDAPGGPPG